MYMQMQARAMQNNVHLLLYRERDLLLAYSIIGMAINEVLNKVLKFTLQQARPLESPKGGFGMPSAHSQFMFYLVGFWGACLLSSSLLEHKKRSIWFLYGILSTIAMLTPVSRVLESYHTVEQVVVGSVIGLGLGILWKYLHYYCIPFLIQLEKNLGKIITPRSSPAHERKKFVPE